MSFAAEQEDVHAQAHCCAVGCRARGHRERRRLESLRLDTSSEAAFAQSLTVFKDKLSPARRLVFGDALKDIWLQGTMDSAALQREYTASELSAARRLGVRGGRHFHGPDRRDSKNAIQGGEAGGVRE